MNNLKRRLYGDDIMHNIEVGDRVKARLFNGDTIGTVTQVIGSSIFMQYGSSVMCLHANSIVKIPGLKNIGYASRGVVQ